MSLKFYTNMVSGLGKGFAKGILASGLLLIGLGALILALPEIFAAIAAALLIIAGTGLCVTAVRIFWGFRRFGSYESTDSDTYRKDVKIHIRENYDDQ